MPARLTYTPELGAQILGARLVGATLRDAAKAAGVPWQTFKDWLRAGREGDPRLADFAAKIDKAASQYEQVLRAHVMRGVKEDPRLAFDVLKWVHLKPERDAKLRALKAQAEVDEKRATGELVERHEHSVKDPLDELRSRLDRLALAGEAQRDPRGSHE